MPAKDLGESAKKLVISALKEVFGHELTLNEWEETAQEEGDFFFLVPNIQGSFYCYGKEGIRIEAETEVIDHLGEQFSISCGCIFDIHGRPNSLYLKLDNGDTNEFYVLNESSLLRLEGATQT